MDLHSPRHKSELEELQSILLQMGCYEDGMRLKEMRDLVQAIQMSTDESQAKFSDYDMQHAKRESEMDFMHSQHGPIFSSTMMSDHSLASPSDTIAEQAQILTVQAQVHHAVDWSPPSASISRKRPASTSIDADMRSTSLEMETCFEADTSRCLDFGAYYDADSSRSSYLYVPYKKFDDEDSYSNLLGDVGCMQNIPASGLETTSNDRHEIRGPVSERRIHDSGMVESHDTPHIVSSSVLSSSTPHPSVGLSNQQSNLSFHEICDPIPMQVTHDSGLNLSTEAPNSSSVINVAEQPIDTLHVSANRAESPHESLKNREHLI